MEKKYAGSSLLIKIILLYAAAAALFYTAARHQILYVAYDQVHAAQDSDGNIGEITDGRKIRQEFQYAGNYIRQIRLKIGTYARSNAGQLDICLKSADKGTILWQSSYTAAEWKDNEDAVLEIEKQLPADAGALLLEIESRGCTQGNAVTIYSGEAQFPDSRLTAGGGQPGTELVMGIYGDKERVFGKWYWVYAALAGAGFILWYFGQMKKERAGMPCLLHQICRTMDTYRFLIKQLVSRDFKTKYKRSVLGAFWSLLNPLLTMAVQYVVFSTIFRNSIENYPVYLLSASILFNFFTESVNGGLQSIVGNASLITKVYVPKYIYPVTKVLSTAINLLISMLPLLAVILITGEQVAKAYLLIPYVLFCLLLFCIGMSLFLAALMVFFRDMQFLWGIISLLWMYMTPMFYPEEIIPERFRMVLDFNPMYHYISFFRTILLEHVSPQLGSYVVCLLCSLAVCAAGAAFFNHHQKKFVLYL